MSESTIHPHLLSSYMHHVFIDVHIASFPWPQAGGCTHAMLSVASDRKPNPNWLKQKENVLVQVTKVPGAS